MSHLINNISYLLWVRAILKSIGQADFCNTLCKQKFVYTNVFLSNMSLVSTNWPFGEQTASSLHWAVWFYFVSFLLESDNLTFSNLTKVYTVDNLLCKIIWMRITMVFIVALVKLVNKWRTSQSSCLLLCPGHTGLVASLLANEAWSFSLIALVTIYNKAVGYDLHIHTKHFSLALLVSIPLPKYQSEMTNLLFSQYAFVTSSR